MSVFSTPARPAQRNNSGNIDANALVQFSGEVLRTFQAQNKMLGITRTRTITNGRSASFAGIGIVNNGTYATGAGTWLDNAAGNGGNNPAFSDKVVNVDAMYLASTFVPDWEDWIMHYDVRGPLAQELGTFLANVVDWHLIRTAARGARALNHWLSGRVAGASGVRRSSGTAGTTTYNSTAEQAAAAALRVLKASTVEIDSSDIQAQLFAHARILTERNCPMEGRYTLLRPLQFYTVVATPGAVMSRDYSTHNGSAIDATLPSFAGLELVMSNQYLADNSTGAQLATGAGGTSGGAGNTLTQSTNSYRVDLAPSRLLTFHRDALATVSLKSVQIQTEQSVRAQGTFIVGRFAAGHDVLRQEFILETARGDTGTLATADLATTMAADGTNA